MTWKCPPVTDDQLRAAGFTAASRQFPRSEASARWIAWFNGISLDQMPAAWCYASNAWMLEYCEQKATAKNGGATDGR